MIFEGFVESMKLPCHWKPTIVSGCISYRTGEDFSFFGEDFSSAHPSWCVARRRQRGELTEAEVNRRREHRSTSSCFVEKNGSWLEGSKRSWGSRGISKSYRYGS